MTNGSYLTISSRCLATTSPLRMMYMADAGSPALTRRSPSEKERGSAKRRKRSICRRFEHRKHLVPACFQRGRRMRGFSHGSFYCCRRRYQTARSSKRNLRVQAMCLFDGHSNSQVTDEALFDGLSQVGFTSRARRGTCETMTRRIQVLCFGFSLALLAISSSARADVQVTFTAPETYVDAGLLRRDGARAREVTLRTIREQLVRARRTLSRTKSDLEIEVLDIDLAGELEWWHGPYDIRYLAQLHVAEDQAALHAQGQR